MSEAVKQYPEWQQALREAQAARDNEDSMIAVIKRDKEAEKEREIARNLVKALMHFGFYLEIAPETNLVTIEGFNFCLSAGEQYTVNKNGDGKEWVRFDLRVSKPTTGRYTDDEQIRYRHIGVDTSYDPKQEGWDKYLVALADAFDEIEREVAFDLEQYAAYQARQEERRLNPPEAVESDEAKLLKLLETLVRKEVSKQLDFSL